MAGASILNSVRELIRKYRWTFLAGSVAAVALRLLFIVRFANINGDSLIYADIANNWLHHGVFALTENGVPVATLIRVPGYPAFMAAIFALFHTTSMLPILYVQMFVDLATCFVVAALAWEFFQSEGTARVAFVLAAACPFTANYIALPLTETLAIFFTAFAILLALKGTRAIEEKRSAWRAWAGSGLAIGAGILLRPDGGLLLVSIGLWLVSRSVSDADGKRYFAAALVVTVISVAPLAPWTVRNWRMFHVIQPLAPRYANSPDEYVPAGFNHWVKTWMVEYVSVEDVFWKVSTETPGETVYLSSLPPRAFDSAEERERTEQLLSEFNNTLMLTPETDAGFAELARERIAHKPLRYYVWLPMLRATDMWLRPRTEMLPVEPRWWTFDDPLESWIAIAYGTLNLLLVAAAVVGVRFRAVRGYGLLLGFMLLRTMFFSTIENPEPRYMLECFPVILVIAAAALHSSYENLRERFGKRAVAKIAA
ncbi:MAG: hypothetical protein JWO13_2702 [Acidobacteriales bacterium]|nr:hypothetical protein [Terriglobales bacterium]